MEGYFGPYGFMDYIVGVFGSPLIKGGIFCFTTSMDYIVGGIWFSLN